ncbi:MAG: prepilin-type N-terminal cleavage/methylation domain-containing protein, partial [Planctomycetota bacterium]|nr:prepilin-type N-terminal cleavage/methylation domain-containing protein [Planctomycetota bacterium]
MHRVNLMQNSPVQRQAHTRSQTAFTLVELLVVLVIIGMLASMVSFAMFRSMQAAREAKTQALISKLHNVIARHWDTFETGQPPEYISTETPPAGLTSEEEARWRAQQKVLRWMKDEMPCTSGEFNQSTLFSNTLGLSVSSADADAQCLYQIV